MYYTKLYYNTGIPVVYYIIRYYNVVHYALLDYATKKYQTKQCFIPNTSTNYNHTWNGKYYGNLYCDVPKHAILYY